MRFLAACALLAAAATPSPAATIYSRPVEVPAAGTYALALDFETHGYGAGSLRLLDASGHAVPVSLVEAPGPSWVDARVTAVERVEAGWWVVVELDAAVPAHDRLRFEAAGTGLAEGVRLEQWRDGAWAPLAAGDLFRLGDAASLQGLELAYEATGARRLRLLWPADAGLPELTRVRVAATGDGVEVEHPALEACEDRSGWGWTCSWRLPERSRRLEVEAGGDGPIGFRLWSAAEGAWTEEDSGVLPGSGERRLVLERGLPAGGTVRLDLHGAGHLTAARSERPVRRLLFEAAAPGLLTLEYGEGVAPGPDAVPGRAAQADVSAGPESEKAASEPADRRPGAATPAGPFEGRWSVEAPQGPAPWASLELPQEVYGVASPALQDVRLASADRLVPFLLRAEARPAVVERLVGRVPQADGEGTSVVELGDEGRPGWSQVLVATGSSPLERRARLTGTAGRGPDGNERRVAGAWTPWSCAAAPPLPCVVALRPPAAAPTTSWRLEIEDGDDAPLPSVTVEILRRRHRLVFPIPVEGDLQLLAGDPDLGAPRFDLTRRAGQILAEPAAPAAVGPFEPAAPSAEPRLARALWLAGLAAAVAVLLWVLARTLRPRPSGG
ncbi:MAG: hypothetical protein R2991_08675 [Thermoanaerobaculia bacterium]